MRLTFRNRKTYIAVACLFTFASIYQVTFRGQIANAATLTKVLVRFDRMQVSTTTTGIVCATPTSTATEASAIVAFPTGFVLGSAATFTVSTTNNGWPTGATAWPSIATATNVTGQNVTFPSGDLTVGTLYCFNWTNAAAVTTPSSASNNLSGSLTTQTSAPAAIDTAPYTTAVVTNDQIVITATVAPSFSFALNANSDSLGTLSTSSVTASPTPRTATVNTNAKNGWTVWAYDNVPSGIHSNSANYTILGTTPGTNSTLSAGTEGYNLGVTAAQSSGSGTITVQAPFVGGALGKGSGIDTTQRPIAISNGSANNAVLTLTNNLSISAITPAATDYSDTEYITAAGLF